jgi:hypothetical protein
VAKHAVPAKRGISGVRDAVHRPALANNCMEN